MELIIATIPCWKCGNQYNVCWLKDDFMNITPDEWNELYPEKINILIDKANENGVILKTEYSKTLETKYLACSCNSCNAFCGSFFLGHEIIPEAKYVEEWNLKKVSV